LHNVQLTSWFPADQIFPDEGEVFSATLSAVRRAGQLANAAARAKEGGPEGTKAVRTDEKEPAHYLV
jgi:hypothetical protein